MRLLTHNMLACNIKGVTNGFPFKIEAVTVEEREAEFNPDFLRHIVSKLQWGALLEGAAALGAAGQLPDTLDPALLDDEEFLRKFHRVLLELHLEEGGLVCPETGRRFPVEKGVPNLLLNEDEV